MAGSKNDRVPSAVEYTGYPYYEHVLDIEKRHDVDAHIEWMQDHLSIPFSVTAFYLIAVVVFHRYMKERQPVEVRSYQFYWNWLLAVFSAICMYRGYPELVFVLKNYGFQFSVCNNKLNSVSAFWATLYVYSKGFELLETIFVLLRKRLNWIHLVHHTMTFFVSWVFCYERPALGRWGGILNVTVHTFMYSYFALKTTKLRIPESVSLFVTSIQLFQFVFMYLALAYVGYLKSQGINCENSNLTVRGGLIFGFFFIPLFIKYFVDRYFRKPKSIKPKKQ